MLMEKYVIYHSREWGDLADRGWITWVVSDPVEIDGQSLSIAKMVWRGR